MPREKNAPNTFGVMKVQTLGHVDDKPEHDALTINAATDGDLADALAYRGYDVTLKQPTESALESRRKKRDKRLAQKAKEEAKGNED